MQLFNVRPLLLCSPYSSTTQLDTGKLHKGTTPSPTTPIVDTLRDEGDLEVQFQRVNISGEETSGVSCRSLVVTAQATMSLICRSMFTYSQ